MEDSQQVRPFILVMVLVSRCLAGLAKTHREGYVNVSSSQPDVTTRLVRHLFLERHYESDLLPRCGASDPAPVQVEIDLSLRGILDVDEPRQVVTASVWLRWYWKDCRLVWDTVEYPTKTIVVRYKRMWVPDIVLYDSSTGGGFDGMKHFRPIIGWDGTVVYMAPVITTFTCKMDITYFPLDRQVCQMKFASWSYNGLDINVTNKTAIGDTHFYADNGEWTLIGMPVRRHVVRYPCCTEPFPDVTYYLIFQRQHLYYFFNLVMPCIMITAISVLVFYLPPESGEKMSLGVTVLLSLCVFLLMVSERMPATSETVPLIAQYFAATIILVTCSCMMTIITLHVHHRGAGGMEVPNWIKVVVFDWLGQVLYFRRLREKEEDKGDPIHAELSLRQSLHSRSSTRSRHGSYGKENNLRSYAKAHRTGDDEDHMDPSDMDRKPGPHMVHLLREQLDCLKRFSHYFESHTTDMRIMLEWRHVGMVLDRLFLVIIALATVVVTTLILRRAPSYDTEDVIMQIFESEH